jgi:hypothetical protein
MCPAGELRPKYKCKLCGAQLHNVIQNCAAVYDDDTVMCKVDFGCNVQKQRARETTASPARRRSPRKHDASSRVTTQTRSVPPQVATVATVSEASAPKKRRVLVFGSKKRGAKGGGNVKARNTLQDWYCVCEIYSNILKRSRMTKASFLRSPLSGDSITGTASEQVSFGRMLIQFENGALKPSDKMRGRVRKFEDIEKRLIQYLDLRARAYLQDKCGVSWITLVKKSLQFADLLGYSEDEFKASPGWVAATLKNYGKIGINLHGEANNMSEEARADIMKVWCVDFHRILEEKEIRPPCLYNGDQTGLYYQKLPNRIYVDAAKKDDYSGVKQMKDKTRITIMVCTASDGTKVPLSVVGKPKKPVCFRLSDDGKPPLTYTNQRNAWFDRNITMWWIKTVLWPFHLRTQGDVNALLLLDNCTAHDVDMSKLPRKLTIIFLPPNMTSVHQPADMGMIASLKVGYKMQLLGKLLAIFDVEGGYEAAYQARMRQRNGCRGIHYGGKPHLLDAMAILYNLWEGDGKYATIAGVKRCWRKARILPIAWENDINNDVGSGSLPMRDKSLSIDDCQALCGLMRSLQVKADASGIDTGREAYGLEGSFLGEVTLSNTEMEAVVQMWTSIEDDPHVIDAEIEEAIDLLETEASSDMLVDAGDDDEPESMDVVDVEGERPVLTILEAEANLDELRRYSKARNLPSEATSLLDRFGHQIRVQHAALPRSAPTLHQFFGTIKKNKPSC